MASCGCGGVFALCTFLLSSFEHRCAGSSDCRGVLVYIEPMYRGPCIGIIYPTLLGFGGIEAIILSYKIVWVWLHTEKDGLTAYNLVCGFMTEGVYHNALLTDIFVWREHTQSLKLPQKVVWGRQFLCSLTLAHAIRRLRVALLPIVDGNFLSSWKTRTTNANIYTCLKYYLS